MLVRAAATRSPRARLAALVLVATTLIMILMIWRVCDRAAPHTVESWRTFGTTPYDQYQSVLYTPSEHSVRRIKLYADLRDVNCRRTCEAIAQHFPLSLYDWTPQFAEHMRTPFLVLCPEFTVASLQRQVPTPLHFVANPYRVAMTLIADSESNISSWRDMKTHAVIVFEHHFSEQLLRGFSELLDSPIKIVTVRSYQEMYTRWRRGDAELMFLLCSHPNPFVANLSAHKRIKLLSFDVSEERPGADTGAQILDPQLLEFEFPGILRINVPLWYNECKHLDEPDRTKWMRTEEMVCQTKRYTVNSLDQYHRTYGFRMMILATENVPDSTTATLLHTLYQKRKTLYQTMRWMIRDDALVYCPPTLSVHAGARAYMEERDLIKEERA